MRAILVAVAGAVLLLGSGCQTGPQTQTDKTGVTYSKTIHNFYVWTAPGFQFSELKGKPLGIAPTGTEVAAQKEAEEADQFDRLRRMLRDELVYALDAKNIFGPVRQAENATNAAHVLDTAVVEYYPGNAALRFTVGFGAGYPSITVRGTLREAATGRSVFQFRTQREFEARPFEYTDSQILDNNVKDLAVDLADYLSRSINGQPLKD